MKKTQISTTAKGIAAMRAIESEKPVGQRICYDPLARQLTSATFYLLSKLFAAYGERHAPGAQGFVVCRCRYFDDYVERCIGEGIRQLVILGAGLDSKGYREEMLRAGVKTFEVDQAATQASKVRRIREVFKDMPRNVVHVPIDFNEESLDKMMTFSFDRSSPTLFILEGVTYYLRAEAVDATLAWIHQNAARGSRVVFDYVHLSALTDKKSRGEIRRLQRYQRFTGEGLTFGIEKDRIADFMLKRGYRNVVDADFKELKRKYCTGANEGRAVAEVYSIVFAEL